MCLEWIKRMWGIFTRIYSILPKTFTAVLNWHLFIAIKWKCKYFNLYNFNRKKKFSFVCVMMRSSIEMESKFLQKFKTIYLRKLFKKIIGLISWAISPINLNKKLWFVVLCVWRRYVYKSCGDFLYVFLKVQILLIF